jgi:hypothetical protein
MIRRGGNRLQEGFARRRRFPTRRIIDEEDRVVDDEGGWCYDERGS